MTLRLALPPLVLALGSVAGCNPLAQSNGGSSGAHGSPAAAGYGQTATITATATGTATSAASSPAPTSQGTAVTATASASASSQPLPTPAAGQCYKTDQTSCQVALEIFQLVNAERVHPTRDNADHTGPQAAMPPFAFSPKWSYIAAQWSQSQAQAGQISHDGFPDARASAFAKEFGYYNDSLVGENVAMASASVDTVAQQFFTMWKNSDGHYRNMMIAAPAIGIGVAADGQGDYYGTQIFGSE